VRPHLVCILLVAVASVAAGLCQTSDEPGAAEGPPPSIERAAGTSGSNPSVGQRPYQRRETWYEFLLNQVNKEDFDYGAWIEQRRKAFLQARLTNPHFWFAFFATAALALLMVMHAKLWIDHRRSLWAAAEFLADVANHDGYSRKIAREAIERYNRHMEACNRVIEAAETGKPTPTAGELEDTRRELERLRAELNNKTTENLKLQADLDQKSATLAELSVRVEKMARQLNRPSDATSSTGSAQGNGSTRELVDRINRLEQELYAERQKNRRLKGA